MAGQEEFLLQGGMTTPSLGTVAGGGFRPGQAPQHGAIALIVLAAAVLYLLDRFGFRFVVTTGRH